jgi:hypothetical protein
VIERALVLDPLTDLFSMNLDIARRINSKAHSVALYGQHSHDNVRPNHDPLAGDCKPRFVPSA